MPSKKNKPLEQTFEKRSPRTKQEPRMQHQGSFRLLTDADGEDIKHKK